MCFFLYVGRILLQNIKKFHVHSEKLQQNIEKRDAGIEILRLWSKYWVSLPNIESWEVWGSAFVLEWTPEEASLLSPGSTFSAAASVYISRNMEDSHHTFCMRLVYVSFTLLICSCMFIIIETLHDQSFSLTSEDSLRDSKPPVTEYPRTKGQELWRLSVWNLCLCHSQ